MTMQKPAPCADCMTRRHFLATTALSAAGLAVTGCGDGDFSGIAPEIIPLPSGPITIKVGDHAGLATSGTIVAILDSIGVKRTGAATFDAMSLFCTHQGCRVTISTNTQLDCPCHFSQFDGNGNVTRGPADRPLPRYTTAYDAATDILTIG
jgi:Rieske Fe-S protein